MSQKEKATQFKVTARGAMRTATATSVPSASNQTAQGLERDEKGAEDCVKLCYGQRSYKNAGVLMYGPEGYTEHSKHNSIMGTEEAGHKQKSSGILNTPAMISV